MTILAHHLWKVWKSQISLIFSPRIVWQEVSWWKDLILKVYTYNPVMAEENVFYKCGLELVAGGHLVVWRAG